MPYSVEVQENNFGVLLREGCDGNLHEPQSFGFPIHDPLRWLGHHRTNYRIALYSALDAQRLGSV